MPRRCGGALSGALRALLPAFSLNFERPTLLPPPPLPPPCPPNGKNVSRHFKLPCLTAVVTKNVEKAGGLEKCEKWGELTAEQQAEARAIFEAAKATPKPPSERKKKEKKEGEEVDPEKAKAEKAEKAAAKASSGARPLLILLIRCPVRLTHSLTITFTLPSPFFPPGQAAEKEAKKAAKSAEKEAAKASKVRGPRAAIRREEVVASGPASARLLSPSPSATTLALVGDA